MRKKVTAFIVLTILVMLACEAQTETKPIDLSDVFITDLAFDDVQSVITITIPASSNKKVGVGT